MTFLGNGNKRFVNKLFPKKMFERRKKQEHDTVTYHAQRRKFTPSQKQKESLLSRISLFGGSLLFAGLSILLYVHYGQYELNQNEKRIEHQKTKESVNSLIKKGDRNMEIHAYTTASKYYEQALEIDPNNTEIKVKLFRAKKM